MKKKTTLFLPVFTTLLYLFLYVPIIVLIVFSFNNNPFSYDWLGFTNQWYVQLFESIEAWTAIKNSFIVATSSMLLSVSMGVFFVFYGAYRYVQSFLPLFYASLAIPEIVLAVGLLSFFSFFNISLGITSLIASHTLLGLGYVVPIVYMQFVQLDPHIMEASYDLGATRMQTFLTIALPLLSPALFTSAVLVFLISFDDFVLSFFCSGTSTQTLPMYIFSILRAGDDAPLVTALSTLLLIGSSILVFIFSSLQLRKMSMPR